MKMLKNTFDNIVHIPYVRTILPEEFQEIGVFVYFNKEQIDWIKNDLARHQDDLLRFTFRHIVFVGYTPTWWPKWENETCNVNMALYGHYAQNKVMTRGKTVYVQTADVRKHGWYRLVHVRNGRIIRFDPPQTIAGSLSHDGT